MNIPTAAYAVGLCTITAMLCGCPSTGHDPADASIDLSPRTGDLPCDVAAVLQTFCQPCHQQPPKNKAPWPLLTYEDTQQPRGDTGPRWLRMKVVIEQNALPHMPPRTAPQPAEADLNVLRAWFAAGAPGLPEGTGCDGARDLGARD